MAQIGLTAVVSETLTPNTINETVNGTVYLPYQVWTAAHPLMVDNPAVVLVETFATPIAARVTNIQYELGKVIPPA